VAVSVLVITCPCALGLALPLGAELVRMALRRRGVLLRRQRFLSRGRRVRKVIFDKTGTITRARLALTPASRRELARLAPERRAVLRAMTARSSHPVSRCLHAALTLAGGDRDELPPGADPDTVREAVGRGLAWTVGDREYRLGRPAFALGEGAAADAPGPAEAAAVTGAVFACDGVPLARWTFREDLRPDAVDEVRRLQEQGYAVYLLSGDRTERVRAAARRLGLPPERVAGDLSPEAKADAVRELDEADTLMVGDGLNDAPALSAAWTAATPGADQAVMTARADLYYLGDGVSAVRRALQAVHRLHRVQRDVLVLAALYNLGAVAACLAGVVGPLAAAVLMPLSSVTLVGMTAWRLTGRRAWSSWS